MERSSPKSPTQPRRRSRHSAAIAALAAIEADAVALAERARLAMAELERADTASPDTYATNDLPPGVSRKTFHRLAPMVPGALVEGTTRDRHMVVNRHAWHAHRQRPTLARTTSAPAPVDSDDAAADEMLAAVGLRATSGGRR